MPETELDFRRMPKWMPEALDIMAMIETWARAYEVPREAIIRQIPIAYAWAQSNKNKAPKKLVLRYLNNFMRKAKEFGNLTVQARTLPPPPRVESEPDMSFEEMQEIRRGNMGQRTDAVTV